MHAYARTWTIFLLFLALAFGCGPATANGPRLQVEAAWARPTASGGSHPAGSQGEEKSMGSIGAVYFTLINSGDQPDRLLRVTTTVAEKAELHQTRVEEGVARMVPVTDGVPIPAGERVVFEPGGYHVMLMGVRQPLRPGDRFSLTLILEQSDPITVNVEVSP
ncbi:MAG: copper chaperone PCu(A)C [Ardenticatenia bacterium]|nr:copper chaperone PCu(A)C [Ardenticatenia bacterium]